MKRFIAIMATILVTLLLIGSTQNSPLGSIKGTVNPSDAGVVAWAISAKDTFKGVMSNGTFMIPDVKAGIYTLVIEARAPYKNGGKADISVANAMTDVGEILLTK